MQDFLGGVVDLIFGDGTTLSTSAHHRSDLLIFAVGCAFMGITVVLLDWIVFSVQKKSILQLSYTSAWGTTRLFLLWGIGAGLGGFLGSAANILTLSRLGCISVGVAWPLILPRLVNTLDDDVEQPAGPIEEGKA